MTESGPHMRRVIALGADRLVTVRWEHSPRPATDEDVKLWNSNTGELVFAVPDSSHAIALGSDRFVTEERLGKAATVRDAATGAELGRCGHDMHIERLEPVDESRFITLDYFGVAIMWNADTCSQMVATARADRRVSGGVKALDSTRFLIWDDTGSAEIWDVFTGRPTPIQEKIFDAITLK